MEACRNMVPVSKVVYNILTKLEEPFNLSFLEMLFSQINLREYPNLEAIHRSFRNGMRLLKYLWGHRSMRGVAMESLGCFPAPWKRHFNCPFSLWEGVGRALSQMWQQE